MQSTPSRGRKRAPGPCQQQFHRDAIHPLTGTETSETLGNGYSFMMQSTPSRGRKHTRYPRSHTGRGRMQSTPSRGRKLSAPPADPEPSWDAIHPLTGTETKARTKQMLHHWMQSTPSRGRKQRHAELLFYVKGMQSTPSRGRKLHHRQAVPAIVEAGCNPPPHGDGNSRPRTGWPRTGWDAIHPLTGTETFKRFGGHVAYLKDAIHPLTGTENNTPFTIS